MFLIFTQFHRREFLNLLCQYNKAINLFEMEVSYIYIHAHSYEK